MTPFDLVEINGQQVLNMIDSRLPDPSVLCLRFQTDESCVENRTDSGLQIQRPIRKLHDNFLASEFCSVTLNNISEQLKKGKHRIT